MTDEQKQRNFVLLYEKLCNDFLLHISAAGWAGDILEVCPLEKKVKIDSHFFESSNETEIKYRFEEDK